MSDGWNDSARGYHGGVPVTGSYCSAGDYSGGSGSHRDNPSACRHGDDVVTAVLA